MASSSTLVANAPFDELRWVIQIRKTIEEELDDVGDDLLCIFSVPKTLMSSKPDAYIPQQVALGPYNYWRPELFEMERYKLSAAKRTQKQLQTQKFQSLVDQLTELEPRIRGCYHKYLNLNGETLAWMMAVDGSFLLEFLQIFAIKEGKILTRVSSKMSHLVDYTGKKSAYNTILRDILLLENQIPLFVLKTIMELQYPSIEIAHDVLHSMLVGLCYEVCPFNVGEGSLSRINMLDCAHLLDVLYNIIVPKSQLPCEIRHIDDGNRDMEDEEESASTQTWSGKRIFKELWKLLSKLNKGPIRFIKKIIFSRPIKFLAKLPWKIITRLPGFAILAQPVQYIFFKASIKPDEGSSLINEDRPPLVEEITIPSVTELAKSGVRFARTNKDHQMIYFDFKTVTLHLPTISLDVNTEVVLRNLVAYEASSNSCAPVIITRYTELMNGIIDTEEDAKFLREKGIVLNRLKSDGEVADLWNGMTKSVRLTRVPSLDKVIEDVNKYYNSIWKVKWKKLMKNYIFESWQFLTLLAAIFLLLLLSLQAFCSVYTCSRFFRMGANPND